MTRERFVEALETKVKGVIADWPSWKHEVLQNCFRSANTTPRQVVVVNPENVVKRVGDAVEEKQER
jgi:hypothetical protein